MIPFTKASACGNDFLIIDGAHAPADLHGFTRRICDRHNGVGADGVEWLFPAQDAEIRARLINADGSEAEISGNGTRCVAAYLVQGGAKNRLAIKTGAGTKVCSLASRDRNHFEFEMDMGEPQVGDDFSLKLASGEVRGTPVSMGNPHYVVLVNEFEDGWQGKATEIQRSAQFHDHGVNVELVVIDGKHDVSARFFERGVGETQSSGTGSCAAAVAAITAGKAESPVRVHAPGGVQTVRKEGNVVFLRGTARLVCRGEFFVS